MNEVIRVANISKSFSGVRVLSNVSVKIENGEIQALVGQNGAGKSTLVKIIAGIYAPDSGEILYDNSEITGYSIQDISELGIAFIHQELDLIESFTVSENMFLGSEIIAPLGLLRKKTELSLARETLKSLRIDIDPGLKVSELTIAQKQLITISKAILKNPKLLILDEPTSRLSSQEVDELFRILTDLSEKGVSMLYISHRLEEIYKICSTVSILRNGKLVKTGSVKEIERKSLIKFMIGEDVAEEFPERVKSEGSKIVLQIENLSSAPEVKDVTFFASEGEIVSLVGTVGAGKSEIFKTIFGERKVESGRVMISDIPVNAKHPGDLFKLGCGFCPEDRKGEGLVLEESISRNITITELKKFSKFTGKIIKKMEDNLAGIMVNSLGITCQSVAQRVQALSGGNQQKVVLAKWLHCNPDILFLDEPTIGIDVESRIEAYKILREQASKGKCSVIATSDIHEALGISDRIIVIYAGRSVAEFNPAEVEAKEILNYVMGGDLK